MAEIAALARPYAEAVFLMADEKGELDQWSKMLGFFKSSHERRTSQEANR